MAIKQINYNNKTFNISYDILNPSCENTIIFLHGWASNKKIMKQAFGTHLQDYKHIYIDMPGFGKSDNEYILTTLDYGYIIKEFLQQLNSSFDIIAGHSFGGKVATLLNPKKLVLISSAGIVEKKNAITLLTIRMAKIFNKCGLKKVTKLLRSNDVDSMNENMYETFKNVVDEDFSERFSKYKGETLMFWGDKDSATTLSSAHIIHDLIENSKLTVFNGDHYFFLKNSKDISNAIS